MDNITIIEVEDMIKRIKAHINNNTNHLDWLMAKRIQFLNKRNSMFDEDLSNMIKEVDNSLEYNLIKLNEYELIVKNLKEF